MNHLEKTKMKSHKTYLFFFSLIIVVLVLIYISHFFHQPQINIGKTNDMFDVADVKHGASISRACTACHSLEKGEPHKVGPNLFGVVGAKIARLNDFTYTDSLLAKKDDHWTIDNLDEWLRNPSDFAPGTKMAFGGLLDPQDRMDLIAYLATLK